MRFAALVALAAVLVVPTALAHNDSNYAHLVSLETQKFNEKISSEAAEMRAKGEWPKTGQLTATSPSCALQPPVQPFLRWGDGADYTPVPGGTFEGGAPGWTLENNARVVTSSARDLGGGTRALSIPKGNKVTTRSVCITEFHPTIRFFAYSTGGATTRLLVEVLYEDLGGSVKAMPLAYLKPSSTWQPTLIVPIHVNLRAAVALSKNAAVAFRLTAEGDEGAWYVDGFYVDPYKVR